MNASTMPAQTPVGQRRFGCILPGSRSCQNSNWHEFADIRQQLRARGIEWFERELRGNSTIFWFYESNLSKLPVDETVEEEGKCKQFLPVEDESSGHGVCVLDKYLDAHPGEDRPCNAIADDD